MATNPTTNLRGGLTPPADNPNADANATDTAALAQPDGHADAQEESEEVEGPRKLVGLQNGRVVNYVLNSGKVRPMIVVDAGDLTGKITGLLCFVALDDANDLPRPLVADASGHKPTCVVLLENVEFCDADPGESYLRDSWHWPIKQAVMAASVDPNAINTAVVAMLEPIVLRLNQRFMEQLNEKLAETVDTVNKLLSTQSEAIQDVLEKSQRPVLVSQGTGTTSPAETGTATAPETPNSEAATKTAETGS